MFDLVLNEKYLCFTKLWEVTNLIIKYRVYQKDLFYEKESYALKVEKY